MNFEQLRIFLTVARCHSFTRAAEELYISHSTTSRSVAALEEALGVKLLTRDTRVVTLTSAGEILFRDGEKLLKKVAALTAAVRNAAETVVGSLSITGAALFTRELFDGCCRFKKSYPELHTDFYCREPENIAAEVEAGTADLGITLAGFLPKTASSLEKQAFGCEDFCVAVPQGHPFSERGSVPLAEVCRLNELSAAAPQAELLQKLNIRSGFLLFGSKLASIPALETLFLQVRTGKGVSLVPRALAKDYGEGCALLNIEAPKRDCEVVLLWRRDNRNPSLPIFLNTLLSSDEQR